MRWDQLRVETQATHRLPGYRDEAVVRTFNAPEAMDVRFYEVQAKSALNRVPEQSRMPFRWTINPYRGCLHACLYCMAGPTPILMANGRTKPLAQLRVGDEIYGTGRVGRYRRYRQTKVLAHWSTFKPAYRVTLHDGTELISSGDHRFLTRRRVWKHVSNNPPGTVPRAHLTDDDELLGTGGFAESPVDSPEYRRGYICGMVRGDADLGSQSCRRANASMGTRHDFRLAITDFDALRRAQRYLHDEGVETTELPFAEATIRTRASRAIRTGQRSRVQAIRDLIEWPRHTSSDWQKGFLAGIFDAEGSYGSSIRIHNKDHTVIDWTVWCLSTFGFESVVEPPRPDGCVLVRLTGGLREALRFFHTVDPAITRKRLIGGTALKGGAPLRVGSVEPLGFEMPMYDITTGTGDFIANGVVSHNCFARPTHKYLDFNAGRDFEREIVVKVNVPELLRAELARPKWEREHVALGTNTDPYQWVEGRYELMPGIWEAFRDFANPCSVLTKSPLLLRDKELLQQVAERAPFTASFSVPTLDEKAWRETEPHTPHPRARLEAVAELTKAGIPTGILIAPLMPGINDAPEQVEKIVEIATAAGAVSIGGIALHLRGEVRGIFMDWLRAHRPDLVPRYEELYRRSAYAPKAVQERLAKLASAPGVPPRSRRFLRDRDEGVRAKPETRAPPEPEQSALF
jgi:DNA repair photolyase